MTRDDSLQGALGEFEYLLTDLWVGGKSVTASDGGRFDVLSSPGWSPW